MFGRMLDYLILKPFTHRRNLKTEDELNSSATCSALQASEQASSRLQKLIVRLGGHFQISDTLRYLDIGCGTGDIAIALANAGCAKVSGIDFVPRMIDKATRDAKTLWLDDRVNFICADIHHWKPPHQYDVILSHEALEHISNPQAFLEQVAHMMAPEGILILAFGPLFHSPFGDHMGGFFRAPIPWRGVIFSQRAVLRLRKECFRSTDQAARYEDISGGLNLMRYSEFLNYVNMTGWEFTFLCVNPQLKRLPPLYHLSSVLIQIPLIRDYFASSIYAILRRR